MRVILLVSVIIMGFARLAHSDELVGGETTTSFDEDHDHEYDDNDGYDVTARASSCHTSVTENPKLRKKFAPVWSRCAPGCSSPLLEILPSAKHCKQKTPSCHHTGNAIDIHRVKCGAKTYTGKTEDGIKKFTRIVKCFKGSGWTTYWQDAKHIEHFHLQPGDCVTKKGCCKTIACLD